MVLADGGVVCIDEFDKMRETDRVAIHEAMEQQTISVAKAGITTILNSRSSVLAAANPVYGRYDDSKTAAENIDFLPTILSRFDLIFVVRDIRNAEIDKTMAHHIMNVHMNNTNNQNIEGEVPISILKKYVSYCRLNCAPRLSQAAMDELKKYYIKIREDSRIRSFKEGSTAPAVPITVRQLEAIIRITESLAKMTLTPLATVEHVQEATRLFTQSTIAAASSGLVMSETLTPEFRTQVEKAEEGFNRRMVVGSIVKTDKIIRELESQGYNQYAIRHALQILISKGDYVNRNQRKTIQRVK